MKLLTFCPTWGFDDLPFEEFLAKVCAAGYDGIETSFPREQYSKQQRQQRLDAISSHGLELITQHWETVTANFDDYKSEFESRLWEIVESQPRFINSQTGRDFFEFEQNLQLLDIGQRIAHQSGVKIVHEIHRGRFSFAAHITKKFLQARPKIKLTADLSHWCCVAGNMLEDQQDDVELALAHSEHIHSRVGYSEGPQVPDPSAPEWKSVVDIHLSWWMKILTRAKNEGRNEFTITTEFGPPPYMPTIPFSNKPTADQWQANGFIKDLLKRTFETNS